MSAAIPGDGVNLSAVDPVATGNHLDGAGPVRRLLGRARAGKPAGVCAAAGSAPRADGEAYEAEAQGRSEFDHSRRSVRNPAAPWSDFVNAHPAAREATGVDSGGRPAAAADVSADAGAEGND